MPELNAFQKRQIAYKARISDILEASFDKDDFSAGFIRLNSLPVSRVNILATIVHKAEGAYASAVIDDSTGRISLRTFENAALLSKIEVGDFVLVVGRVRSFNDEKYIIPEIVKKTDAEWANVRALELKNMIIAADSGKKIEIAEEPVNDDVYSLIRKLDSGDGALVEDIVKNSKIADAELSIKKLLESGDVFEIKPGRLKVLE